MIDVTKGADATKSKKWPWAAGLLAAAFGAFYLFCGFYSVQPIGALPEGVTAVVWRESGEPFFNSADALCLERADGVSLLCRGMAMAQAPTDRIILRLPYWRFAYLESTDGREYDR
ncbi:hypothetical protein [Pseudoxanthomonas sp. CF125]|uniref:hypothetical protein n=1 Tax=Pseudoxanthomonas sp. CF125 TaxID=1855303 RepID=UPI00087E56CC|nr:hypothetical protein [Pseudoxanthomonas sp. CF125]SDQ24405.1 hypothetical protein SAMN05216569_0264 [Pseudoxanthomonas sp. CF125]